MEKKLSTSAEGAETIKHSSADELFSEVGVTQLVPSGRLLSAPVPSESVTNRRWPLPSGKRTESLACRAGLPSSQTVIFAFFEQGLLVSSLGAFIMSVNCVNK